MLPAWHAGHTGHRDKRGTPEAKLLEKCSYNNHSQMTQPKHKRDLKCINITTILYTQRCVYSNRFLIYTTLFYWTLDGHVTLPT